jgi:glycosyltransferase involved in cell wall biosynthesis
MKIVINALPIRSPLTGVGNYTYNLITQFQRLRPDFEYTYFYGYFGRKLKLYPNKGRIFYYIKEFVKKLPILSSNAREIINKLAYFHVGKYDLYFEPNFIPFDIRAGKTVTTVYDFSFYLHPEWHPKERVDYYSKNFFKRIKKSDAVITISKYVERETLEILGNNKGKIVTIYPGYSEIFNAVGDRGRKIDSNKRYVLFVGSIEPRKNLVSLLKAYLLLPEYIRKEYKLLLVGFKGWENQEVAELINKLKGTISYLGYVSIDELANLYRGASCFVYPSLYEGFGLPPLEAMACGCPVVVSGVTSLPEVCGDAAYYVDPCDVGSIAEGMYKVLSDDAIRRSLVEKGLERAKFFTWEKSAREHLRVFEEVLRSSG